jgi:hypothetical protein
MGVGNKSRSFSRTALELKEDVALFPALSHQGRGSARRLSLYGRGRALAQKRGNLSHLGRGRTKSGRGLHILSHRRQHSVQIPKHFVVPKPQDNEAFVLKPCVSRCIFIARTGVLTAIDLDDDSRFEADEIDDVVAYRLLALPLGVEESLRAQSPPQQSFCIC